MDRKFRTLIAILVSCAFSVAPAAAQDWRGMDRHASHDRGRGPGSGEFHPCRNRADAAHGSRNGALGCSSFGEGFAYADGEWALYNNRSWEPNSYNDWWHDRPDRAFPRWVIEQHARGTCDADRMWWSGSGWHC